MIRMDDKRNVGTMAGEGRGGRRSKETSGKRDARKKRLETHKVRSKVGRGRKFSPFFGIDKG